MFQKNEEQIRVNMLGVPAEYVKRFVEETPPLEPVGDRENRLQLAMTRSQAFQQAYLSRLSAAGLLMYLPQKPLNDAKSAYESLSIKVSQSSIGIKLKHLARVGINPKR